MLDKMLKKSFIIVIIQVLGILFSFASLYFIASDMAPEVYSLVGIYLVLAGIVNTFTHLGIETEMIREALYWIEHDDHNKVSEYATQALMSRTFGFVVLLPFLISYLLYLNVIKFEGEYTVLFATFVIGVFASTLNDCMSVIIRSKGGYVFSQFAKTLNSTIIKAFGIFLYLKFGATVYLYFYGLSSLPLMMLFFANTHSVIAIRHILVKPMLSKVWQSRYLWLRGYMEYFRNYADSILVSILFSPGIMGAYTIYKTLENIVKDFVEGFFDILSQETVRYKGNELQLINLERKYNKVRALVIVFIIAAILLFAMYTDFFVSLCNMNNYIGFSTMVYVVSIVAIIYILTKYEANTIAFFASSKESFVVSFLYMISAILSYLPLFIIDDINGAFLQRILSYSLMAVISIVTFRKYRHTYYTKILK